MNAINRIELAIRRAASQMPDEVSHLFRLVADELALVTHEEMNNDQETLEEYRESQRWP